MRVQCAFCHGVFTGRVSKGGDLPVLVPVWHKTFVPNSGRFDATPGGMAPCPGRFEEATPMASRWGFDDVGDRR